MQKILVSACLLGAKVRYDGGDCAQGSSLLDRWITEGRVISICPEMAGGLPTPRPPSELIGTKVMTNQGVDVTAQYRKGAESALALCQQHQIKFALLKARSPSCGNVQIYDGTFTSTKIAGQGVTAALLTENGIQVFNEEQLNELAACLEA